jgi:hypothetical protein
MFAMFIIGAGFIVEAARAALLTVIGKRSHKLTALPVLFGADRPGTTI